MENKNCLGTREAINSIFHIRIGVKGRWVLDHNHIIYMAASKQTQGSLVKPLTLNMDSEQISCMR